MKIISANITGSLILNGIDISSVTGSESSINSLNIATASLNSATASLYLTTASLNSKTGSYATTGSNVFTGQQNINGSVAVTGSLTTTGTITAQTLNVQQVTSSIIYSSGSNVFGNSISNTQSMTGSVGISGSLAVNGNATITGNLGFGGTATSKIHIFTTGGAGSGLLTELSNASSYATTDWKNNVGAYVQLLVTGTSFTSGIFKSSYAYFNSETSGGAGIIASSATGNIVFGAGGALDANIRQMIFANGNISMGWNTDQGFKLAINGSTYIVGQLRLNSTITNGTYTYTLPGATGTLALTSDLSAYLPLAGGTLTGPLNGTSASFTGAFELNTTGTGALGFFGANNTTDKYLRIRNSSGNFEMGTSSTEHYLIGNGAVPLKFYTNGTPRLTIDGSTGAATFSSSVTATSAAAYSGDALRLQTKNDSSSYYMNIYPTDAGANGITWTFKHANSSATYDTMTFMQGKVGIGTTTPANRLFVTAATAGDYAGFIENTNATNGYGLVARTAHTGTSAYAFAARAGTTDIFVVRADGNVGIGTTTPNAKLTVEGNLYVRGGGILATNTIDSYNNTLNIKSSSVSAIFIDSLQSVGIGTTTPVGTLHISSASPILNFDDTSTTGTLKRFRLVSGDVGTTQTALFSFSNSDADSTGNSNVMTLNELGRVGIGTSTPNSKLTVNGASANSESAQIRIINTGANEQTFHLGYNTTSDYAYLNAYKAGIGYKPIVLNPDGGNVLIGTTTESGGFKLRVNGDTNIIGLLDVSQSTASPINRYSGNGNAQGNAHNYKIVRHYPVVSSGNKLIIPFVSQGNLNSTTIISIMGHSARYNTGGALGFQGFIQVGHLNVITYFNLETSSGNLLSISTSGSNLEINFFTAYTNATADGMYVTIEYMTNSPSYSIDVTNIRMN